jgi:hypothetical protein
MYSTISKTFSIFIGMFSQLEHFQPRPSPAAIDIRTFEVILQLGEQRCAKRGSISWFQEHHN